MNSLPRRLGLAMLAAPILAAPSALRAEAIRCERAIAKESAKNASACLTGARDGFAASA